MVELNWYYLIVELNLTDIQHNSCASPTEGRKKTVKYPLITLSSCHILLPLLTKANKLIM